MLDMDWVRANYVERENWEADGLPVLACRRCGQSVGYLTKHAAERHGDQIEVLPATNSNPLLAEAY